MAVGLAIAAILAFFIVILLAASLRVLREYERGVIFRLGRLIAQKGPGLILLIPIVDRMVRVDLRAASVECVGQGRSARARDQLVERQPEHRTCPDGSAVGCAA